MTQLVCTRRKQQCNVEHKLLMPIGVEPRCDLERGELGPLRLGGIRINPSFFWIRASFPEKKFSFELWFTWDPLNRYGPSPFPSNLAVRKSVFKAGKGASYQHFGSENGATRRRCPGLVSGAQSLWDQPLTIVRLFGALISWEKGKTHKKQGNRRKEKKTGKSKTIRVEGPPRDFGASWPSNPCIFCKPCPSIPCVMAKWKKNKDFLSSLNPPKPLKRRKNSQESKDRAELKGTTYMGQSGLKRGFCENLQFPSGFLRKTAPQKCCNSQEKWKSATISENLRKKCKFGSVCRFYFVPLISPWKEILARQKKKKITRNKEREDKKGMITPQKDKEIQ